MMLLRHRLVGLFTTLTLLAIMTVAAPAAPGVAPTIPELAWEPRSDWINVRSVQPAAVGDGVADDTAAIQAPTTPILLVEEASSEGVSPTERGRVLQAICDGLTSQGVKNLHFLPNRGMLGEDGEGTVDGVHPSDLGMMRHADVFTEALRPLLRESE